MSSIYDKEYPEHIQKYSQYPDESLINGWLIRKDIPSLGQYIDGQRIQFCLRKSTKHNEESFHVKYDLAIEYAKSTRIIFKQHKN